VNNYLADKIAAPAPAGPTQIDGNVIPQREKPTKAPLQDRIASPMEGRSGMEKAMGALADQLHKPTRRR
jgi:hypothetical protein